ncbi:MAG TPA: RNA polymerase sigma factor [Gemmatimonadaceae bacterium]
MNELELRDRIARLYREESGRVLATLIRLLGDFDTAEEALHDAFAASVVQWERDGIPQNPRSWLVSAGRHRAIDRVRREARFAGKVDEIVAEANLRSPFSDAFDDESGVDDDRLRLIFTCCHPAIAREAQVALTLRTICGLTTDEIARAFLVPTPTMAQRLVRATGKIRDARIPYRIPPAAELAERLDSVLATVYLVFTEGYAATSGDALVRRELCREAIRLGRLLVELMPSEGEAHGLLALMLLHDARRDARSSPDGELVLLEEQDRSQWDRAQIDEGLSIAEEALKTQRAGVYLVQAAIAALHAKAPTATETDWRQIAALYAFLLGRVSSPVIELNHAVAVAMVDGPAAALLLVDALVGRGELDDYHLLHAARADLLRRLARYDDALRDYEQALGLAQLEPERRFLERRISELRSHCSSPGQAAP